MKFSRRAAWLAFVIALVLILLAGFFRASVHDETRPANTPAGAASTQPR